MKICITYFGTAASSRNGMKFYHGINQTLILEKQVGSISINCPLSTTTTLAVAIYFATADGLAVELGLNASEGQNYLSLAWLSDYPGEKEHLFLQGMPTVNVLNILEIKTGSHYDKVLRAISILTDVFDGNENIPELHDDSMQELTKMILELIQVFIYGH